MKKINAAASYKTALLHCPLLLLLQRFFETIDLLVLKRDHYNKDTKMRKSRTTLIKKTLIKSLRNLFYNKNIYKIKLKKKKNY